MNITKTLFKYAIDFEGTLYDERWFIPCYDLIVYKVRNDRDYFVYKWSERHRNPLMETLTKDQLIARLEKLILANTLKHDLLIKEQQQQKLAKI